MRIKVMIGILFSIFVIGIAGCLLVVFSAKSNIVNIKQNGDAIYTIDLSSAKDEILQIEYEGRINVVQIKNGKIRVLDADCPDKTCVKMGWLSEKLPIVCLPNHLIIEQAFESDNVDAVVD